MPTFRVFGEKIQSFYTDVDAANPGSAFDIAANKPMHNWFEIKNDDVIEVTDVYAND